MRTRLRSELRRAGEDDDEDPPSSDFGAVSCGMGIEWAADQIQRRRCGVFVEIAGERFPKLR